MRVQVETPHGEVIEGAVLSGAHLETGERTTDPALVDLDGSFTMRCDDDGGRYVVHGWTCWVERLEE